MFELSNNCQQVLDLIEKNGYKAYVVGGCIRDYYLSIKQSDFDITTNASISELKHIFECLDVKEYKKGHTLGVIFNHEYFEVSTFDGKDLKEDLENRDFTINSIAYNRTDGFIDYNNGKKDIENKILRCPKNTLEIIKNDPLRMLRAIRFASCYNFKIDDELSSVILNNYILINNVSKSRIAKELNKILLSEQPSNVIRKYHDLFFELIPDLKLCYKFNQNTKWHHLDVFEHILTVLDNVPAVLEIRMAALLHDVEKPNCYIVDEKGGHFPLHYQKSAIYAKELLKEYNYSSRFIEDVYRLVLFHDRPLKDEDACLKNLVYDFGTYNLDLLFQLKIADVKGQNPTLLYRVNDIEKLYLRTETFIINHNLIYLADLNIKAKDIKQLGFKDDMIGIILNDVLVNVRNEKILNKSKDIKAYIINKYIGETE